MTSSRSQSEKLPTKDDLSLDRQSESSPQTMTFPRLRLAAIVLCTGSVPCRLFLLADTRALCVSQRRTLFMRRNLRGNLLQALVFLTKLRQDST